MSWFSKKRIKPIVDENSSGYKELKLLHDEALSLGLETELTWAETEHINERLFSESAVDVFSDFSMGPKYFPQGQESYRFAPEVFFRYKDRVKEAAATIIDFENNDYGCLWEAVREKENHPKKESIEKAVAKIMETL